MAQTLPAKPATAESIYNDVVKSLPSAERFKLATLILNGIPEQAIVDYSTEWSEQDLRDFSDATFLAFEQRELEK